ncbi:MAG TPA: TIGR03668 family PPOX class F420-dependent oxidoreductase [Candidatus Solibacter sp.]|nr:TIGR03668 family PPOX class F420-dependent oxidoreductase [Candidatus Solibacter sp.]
MSDSAPEMTDKVRAKLEEARVARLATVDANGAPHLVPACFVLDGSVLYSGIDRKPKRSRHRLTRLANIETNAAVALLIDEYGEDWSRLWYVLVRGKASVVTEETEHSRAVARLKAKYAQYAAGMLDDDAVIVRITAERITSWGKL